MTTNKTTNTLESRINLGVPTNDIEAILMLNEVNERMAMIQFIGEGLKEYVSMRHECAIPVQEAYLYALQVMREAFKNKYPVLVGVDEGYIRLDKYIDFIARGGEF